MERIFEVNKEKRQAIIKMKQKQLGVKYIVGIALYTIFKIVALISLPLCIMLLLIQDEDLETKFLGLLVVIVFSLVIWCIGILIQLLWEKKFLYLWTDSTLDVIRAYNKTIEYGYYSKADNGLYTTMQIRYADIVRMEYIEKDFCLKIYGPRKVKEWTSHNKERLIGEENGSKESWFAFVEYFDDFEQIWNILEEKTGIKIMKISNR